MAKVKSNYGEIVHNITKKHWIWYTFLVFSPTIWFTFIVPVYGSTLHLKDAAGGFTIGGKIISGIVIVVAVSIALFNNWYASKSEIDKLAVLEGENQYIRKIMSCVDSICDEKSRQIRRTIHQVKSNSKESPEIISNPGNQLKRILEEINACLVTFMQGSGINCAYNDFIVTIAYNFPEESDEWVWGDGTIERGLSIYELTDPNCKSTINYLRNSKKKYYFNNRKEDAKKEDCYIYDPTDETNEANNKPVGSIFCYNYKLRQSNKIYVDAVLSISTQQLRFADEDNLKKVENAKDNMVLLVEEYFGRRISIELGLLYLDYIEK